jgi:hypothetical protein
MDGFLTTVVAGVIVAIVGGIVAYYFGKRQQRQTQAYEKEREEREQLEERQKEQQKQGAEVFGEIQKRMNSILDGLTEYLRRAEMLHARLPSGTFWENAVWAPWRVYDDWKPFLLEVEALFTRSNEIDKAMASLRDYYHAHESFLKPTTRSLFASFDEEIITMYQAGFEGWLGENEERFKAYLERYMQNLDEHQRSRVPVLGRLKDLDIHEEYDRVFSGPYKEFSEVAQLLLSEWDLQAYRTALREEKAKYSAWEPENSR